MKQSLLDGNLQVLFRSQGPRKQHAVSAFFDREQALPAGEGPVLPWRSGLDDLKGNTKDRFGFGVLLVIEEHGSAFEQRAGDPRVPLRHGTLAKRGELVAEDFMRIVQIPFEQQERQVSHPANQLGVLLAVASPSLGDRVLEYGIGGFVVAMLAQKAHQPRFDGASEPGFTLGQHGPGATLAEKSPADRARFPDSRRTGNPFAFSVSLSPSRSRETTGGGSQRAVPPKATTR